MPAPPGLVLGGSLLLLLPHPKDAARSFSPPACLPAVFVYNLIIKHVLCPVPAGLLLQLQLLLSKLYLQVNLILFGHFSFLLRRIQPPLAILRAVAVAVAGVFLWQKVCTLKYVNFNLKQKGWRLAGRQAVRQPFLAKCWRQWRRWRRLNHLCPISSSNRSTARTAIALNPSQWIQVLLPSPGILSTETLAQLFGHF